MYRALVADPHDFDAWRDVARGFAQAGVDPLDVDWQVGSGASDPPPAGEAAALSVPRAFVGLAKAALRSDDPDRFPLLYALLLRASRERDLLADRADPLVRRVEALAHEEGVGRMRRNSGDEKAWAELKHEAEGCTRCHLYRHATQIVFGEGPVSARMMLVGEQPGDQEDLQGRPFVGPAGHVLDRALAAAGIERASTYVSNAVKHFKFEPRGKRRIHSKPDAGEITACRWWIDHERALIKPDVVVALGATAAQSLLGRAVTISRTRGTPIPLEDGSECHVTVHPSYLLRLDDEDRSKEEFGRFVEDLKAANAAVRLGKATS